MIIFLDFDGTIVSHKFPLTGETNPGAMEVIRKLQQKHNVVLNTARVEYGYLNEALSYLNGRILPIKPTQHKLIPVEWNIQYAKTAGMMYIDDIADNIPLKNNMVDWGELDRQFIENEIY
jgi:hypothetical protein